MKTKKTTFFSIFWTLTILIILIFLKNSFSQTSPNLQIAKCLGGSSCSTPFFKNNDDYAVSVIQKKDGGFMLLCSVNSNDGDVVGNHGFMTSDVWVVNLDSLFNVIWKYTYGGSAMDIPSCIIKTLDGNYLFVATVTSTNGDVIGHHGIYDIWVVKINPQGIILWQKCLGGSGSDYVSCVVASKDSGFVISGSTNSNDGDVSGNHGVSDAWLVKINSMGNILWQKSIGGTAADLFSSVVSTNDMCFIALGYTYSNDGDVSGNHGASDAFLVKVDNLGNIIWSKCFGGNKNELMFGISNTFDNGVIICGNTKSNNGNVSGYHGVSNNDGWVAKLNFFGNLEWQKCLGGTDEDNLYTIIQTADSNYISANTSFSTDGDLLGKINHGESDLWVVKLNTTGNIIYQSLFGGSSFEKCLSFIETKKKDYVFAGFTQSNNGDVSGNHLAIINSKITPTNDVWIGLLHNQIVGLPVNLLSFKAKPTKDKVQLTWSTASEIINNYFSIEKSIDGYNYQEIGQVSGAGNSNEVLSYSFFDTSPSFGISYYRLSQTDYNGTKETFAPVPVTYYDEKNVSKIAIYNLMGQPLDVDINSLNSLSSGMYLIISYDKDANILSKVKFFKQ